MHGFCVLRISDAGVGGENRHVGGSQGRKPDDERHRLRRGRGAWPSPSAPTIYC